MRRKHTLMLQARKKVAGSAGQRELTNDGPPQPVRGNFHPLSAEERTSFGIQTDIVGTWFCDTWPGDLFSRVTFRDQEYDVGPAQEFDIGARTHHIQVVLKQRGTNG